MQITIPNEFQPYGKFNIGCTAGIDSTGCQGDWVAGLNRMDMNFVSSKHSRNTFQNLEFDIIDERTMNVYWILKMIHQRLEHH